MSTSQQLSAFVECWECILGVTLNDEPNAITWRWSSSGVYSAACAYEAQFLGLFPHFAPVKIWCAHVEPKILTADNLAI
ncbi:hypothetical protein BRADI_1g57292v3 [Brachypodium distachyon]|uniref:Uncharacterized protein n=1 Tax=Brachypodium distachyon TaxID=15368 RepID=A0A0Q3K8W4_BRADI|nr:hypothetical protein BRADI_1g57292v3 [Brachypodium distachyon]